MGSRPGRTSQESGLIVVDTSVWIDFLEARGTSFDLHLKALIEAAVPLGLTDIIYCEVLQGVLEDRKFRHIRGILRAYPILRLHSLRTFDHAAQIYRTCRRRGFTIRNTVDCVIAATCLEAGAQLYHNDRDFEAVAEVMGLRTYRPPETIPSDST